MTGNHHSLHTCQRSFTVRRLATVSAVGLVLIVGFAPTATAQEVTGTPGSPSATTTIDGKQLPPPPDTKFGGKIERDAIDSTPYWEPRVVPPKGAPNILLIMTDDAGYGVSGTFGGVIPTPAMDRIADLGLRYTHFHSTARRRARRSSRGATTTRSAQVRYRSCRPATPATTP